MPSREERAKLRAMHNEKMSALSKQPTNHAILDENIEIPEQNKKIEIEEKTVEEKVNKTKEPIVEEVKEKGLSSKNQRTKPQKTNKSNEDVVTADKYKGAKRSVKVVAYEDDLKYWLKKSIKSGMTQQDYLQQILINAMKNVNEKNLDDESKEIVEFQGSLRGTASPVPAMMPAELMDEVKSFANGLCMKQTGFVAYAIKLARVNDREWNK